MNSLRLLIVDDEPLIRRGIRKDLCGVPSIVVAGECECVAEAVEAIRSGRVDLVLLDVQLPDGTGFDVVRQVGPAQMPAVVFVTAYDKYAVRAFEAHALDYLLKPFDKERFDDAYARAVAALEQSQAAALHARLRALVDGLEPPAAPAPAEPALPPRLTVRERGRIVLVPPDEIDWIEAEGDYVRLHAGPRRYLLHDSLRHVLAQLDAQRFLQVHRSAAVNLSRVRELVPSWNGEFELILHSGQKLRASRSRREALLTALSGSVH